VLLRSEASLRYMTYTRLYTSSSSRLSNCMLSQEHQSQKCLPNLRSVPARPMTTIPMVVLSRTLPNPNVLKPQSPKTSKRTKMATHIGRYGFEDDPSVVHTDSCSALWKASRDLVRIQESAPGESSSLQHDFKYFNSNIEIRSTFASTTKRMARHFQEERSVATHISTFHTRC
jgi:hypothetical protein